MRSKRKRRGSQRKWVMIALGCALVLTVVILAVWYMGGRQETYRKDAYGLAEVGDNVLGAALTDTKTVAADEMHHGSLILVSNEALMTYEVGQDDLVSVFDYKNKAYKVRDKNVYLEKKCLDALNALMADAQTVSGVSDVIVWSGFRDVESQETIFNERAISQGLKKTEMYVAKPFGSEHHTGLAFDLGIYTDAGRSKDFKTTGEYAYLADRMASYGFVQRYTADKQQITKIADEDWHYRYVGPVHAQVMKTRGLCLEEYIALIRTYPAGQRHLAVKTEDGARWEIYFAQADEGAKTEIPVPSDKDYEISGNNVDGFIVTVRVG